MAPPDRSAPLDRGTASDMIRMEGVAKTFADGTVAVHDLDLAVPRGALVTLVGPSGCGKSTTLKMVNRLIEPTNGRIWLDGNDVTEVDPVQLRRGIGYVIQQVGLFPHQRIVDNVMTVPRLMGTSRDEAGTRARELLDLVGLDADTYAERYPHQLSGGQRQRVGVARALAADPEVLLMDEPFGAVDPVVRGRLQDEFRRLQQDLGKTVMLVTHDLDEAVKLGDRVAVFAEGGRLAQYDTPQALLANPADEFVAGFVGSDRAVRRLDVTRIDPDRLEPLEGVNMRDLAATLPVDSSLGEALSLMLANDLPMIGITAGPRFLGVLTPNGVHAQLRAH